MKHFYFFLLGLSVLNLSAQVANHSVEDCNMNQNSIHQALASGKPLIVLSKGFDCGICISRAAGWGNWATANKSQVEVWGAMTNTYNNTIPSCTQVSNWVSNYGWSDIYTFVDSSEHFFQFGTPRYLVYDPSDSSEAYVGGSHADARSIALSLVSNNNISLKENELEDLQFFYNEGTLYFSRIPNGNTKVEVYNLAGQKERVFTLRKDQSELPLNDLPKGIYLMRLSNKQSALTRKIVLS